MNASLASGVIPSVRKWEPLTRTSADVRAGCVAANTMAIGEPGPNPTTAARSIPTASSTARMSSLQSSTVGREPPGIGSDAPVPCGSRTTTRANAPRLRKNRGEGRDVPGRLHIGEPIRHEQDVMTPRTEDLIRDMKVAALRILSLRFVQSNPHAGLDGATLRDFARVLLTNAARTQCLRAACARTCGLAFARPLIVRSRRWRTSWP